MPSALVGVGIALNDDPFESDPSFTRIDDPEGIHAVQTWDIDQGRQTELVQTEAGTGTLKMVDLDGTFDPTNAGSPFFGKFDPMKPLAIGLYNPISTDWATIYRGFVEDWDVDIDISRRMHWVTLSSMDCLGVMAREDLSRLLVGTAAADLGLEVVGGTNAGGYIKFPQDQQVNDRINLALDIMQWSSVMREIFSGNVSLQEMTYRTDTKILSILKDCADAEFPGVANLFPRKDGYIVFHGRFARFVPENPDYRINFWTVGDADAWRGDNSIVPLRNIGFTRGLSSPLINSAMVLPQNIDPDAVPDQVSRDDASIAKYGTSPEQWDNLIIYRCDIDSRTAAEDTRLTGQYYTINYAEVRNRIKTLTFGTVRTDHPAAGALYGFLQGVDISDVITVKTTHRGGGGFDFEQFFVEGKHWSAKPRGRNSHDLTLTLDVTPRAFYTTDTLS